MVGLIGAKRRKTGANQVNSLNTATVCLYNTIYCVLCLEMHEN